jgi:hypothetical protein
VFELQNALSFLPVFKVKCVKNHYMAKADTTSQSQDPTAMLGTAASLVREWDAQEVGLAMERNTALMKYSFRYSVYLARLPAAEALVEQTNKPEKQPCSFEDMPKVMYEPKLVMGDFVRATDRMASVYNEQVAVGNEVGAVFANGQQGAGAAQQIAQLQADLAARDTIIQARDATILQLQNNQANQGANNPPANDQQAQAALTQSQQEATRLTGVVLNLRGQIDLLLNLGGHQPRVWGPV